MGVGMHNLTGILLIAKRIFCFYCVLLDNFTLCFHLMLYLLTFRFKIIGSGPRQETSSSVYVVHLEIFAQQGYTGHVGIVIDEIAPNCWVKPACSTPFDEDVIEKGAYYIWPLQSLAFHSD